MKLLKINILATIFLAFFLSVVVSPAYANAPDVKGKVVFADTGEGIPGIVVKWVDNNDHDGDRDGVRYAITNSQGEYFFPSFQSKVDRPIDAYESSERLDTDYDGTVDSPYWKVFEISSGRARGFGCKQNSHSFTVIKPPSLNGTFENDGKVAADLEELNNGDSLTTLPTIKFTRTKPTCPSNLKYSCDTSGTSATVSWSVPQGGADAYSLYYHHEPYTAPQDEGVMHSNKTNQLSRTFNVKPNLKYIARVRSVISNLESESCLIEFSCKCSGAECGTGKIPQATLTSCSNATDPYYAYTISNINTFGLPFQESRLMITFSLNAQTQQILNYLSNSSNSSTADFSLWNERKRQKQNGDYFGFYIQTFNSLSGNSLSYQITPSTRIGTKSMAEFRQFLISNGLPLQHPIKANMVTKYGEFGTMFNSHIPASTPIDLSKEFDSLCLTGDCPPGEVCPPPPGSCPAITITQPAAGEVLTPVDNKVTVKWSATGATALTQYEVMIYDRSAYGAPETAYQAYQIGLAIPIAMPNNLIVYTTTANSQVVNFGDIDGLNPAYWMIAIRSTGTDALNQPCDWVVSNPPPPPPGFPVSGKIYRYNPACQPLEEVPIGGTITATGGQIIPVVNGVFNSSLPDTGSSYALQLTLADNTFSCANICGQGPSCVRDNINPTNNTTNYFVKEEDIFTKSWWQVFGGFVFAQNIMNSELPITDDNQSWRLMAELLPGISKTAGIPITNRDRFGNNAPDNTNVAGWLREPPLQVANASLADSIKPNFTYYKDKLELPDTRLPETIQQLTQLNGQTKQGVVIHYREGDLKFAPDSTWSVGGNQHHVVLVQGNITISAENLPSGENRVVSTAPGSTTTFVASGTITIAGNVGNSNLDSLTPNLSGIFIANQLVIEDDGDPGVEDKRFVGEGSYIGWNSVSLLRQFDEVSINENTPSEAFIARPDFVINLPEVIRDSSITWKEVN